VTEYLEDYLEESECASIESSFLKAHTVPGPGMKIDLCAKESRYTDRLAYR
jgi:hypothetical protein